MEDELGQDQGGQDNSQGQESTGINPAWNDLLSHVPQDAHSQVTPLLQQWDQNYQQGINKVHSEYEGYKPYLENGIAPDQINYALQLLDAVESRPQEVMAAMQQYLGLEQEGNDPQLQEQGQNNDTFDITQHPQFIELQNMTQQIAQLLVEQNNQQTQQQEDEELEQEFNRLKEAHGEFDEQWVMSRVLSNPETSLEDAVQQYQEFEKGILAKQQQNPAPRVLGSGQSLPGSQDVKQLDGKGRRSLIVDFLNQQNAQ